MLRCFSLPPPQPGAGVEAGAVDEARAAYLSCLDPNSKTMGMDRETGRKVPELPEGPGRVFPLEH